MSAKQRLIARCRDLNVRLSDDGEALRMDAPKGKVLSSYFTHFTDLYLNGAPRAEAYAELLDSLALGLETCSEPACEICAEAPTSQELQRLFPGEVLVEWQCT